MKTMYCSRAFVIFSALISIEALAQSKTYATIDFGYGLNFGGTPIGYTRTSTANASTYKVQEGSFGAGVNINAYLGHEFGPEGNLAGELGFSQMMGAEKAFESTEISPFNAGSVTESELSKLTVSGFSLAFKMKTGTKADDIRLFVRPGIFVPIQSRYIQEENETAVPSDPFIFTNYSYTKIETRFAFALGYNLAIGVEWKALEKIGLFAQLQGLMLNLPTRRSEVMAYETKSGDNITRRLENLSINERITEYSKEYTIDRIIGSSEPKRESRYAVPASYIGLNVGFKLEFIK
jgi:hypothetical protein